MYSELCCSICEENFDNKLRIPLILPCGHTFCLVCLESLSKLENFSCPEDRITISIPSVSDLPKNFSLIRIISQQSSSPKTCKEHKKPIEFYCIQDQLKICSNCAIIGKHKSHNIASIDDLFSSLSSKVQSLTALQFQLESIQLSHFSSTFEDSIKKTSENINQKQIELELCIKEGFASLFKKLQDSESEALKSLSIYISEIESKLLEKSEVINVINDSAKGWVHKSKNFLHRVSNALEKQDLGQFDQIESECEFLISSGKKINSEMKAVAGTSFENMDEMVKLLTVEFHKTIPKDLCLVFMKSYLNKEKKFVKGSFNERVFNQALDVLKFRTSHEADFSGAGDLGDRAGKIASYLINNSYLKKLKLVKNSVSDQAACEIFKALCENSTLSCLNISQNSLSSLSLDELLAMLAVNTTLQDVYLLGNPKMTQDYKSKLAHMTSKSRRIHT